MNNRAYQSQVLVMFSPRFRAEIKNTKPAKAENYLIPDRVNRVRVALLLRDLDKPGISDNLPRQSSCQLLLQHSLSL